jgi:glutaredoxin
VTIELFQTEWCPASGRVRERLTELGLGYINRQVPVEREARSTLWAATGADTIPALRLENGSAIVCEENVLALLDELFIEPPEAEAHRQKAAKARRSYLEEEYECSQPATR